jgi:hypothetical protein
MKPRLNMVIIFLTIAALSFAALAFTLNQLQAVWTIRIGDGVYGFKQLKSFTFLVFERNQIDVTALITWIPITLAGIAAVAGLLSGCIKYSIRVRPDSKNQEPS